MSLEVYFKELKNFPPIKTDEAIRLKALSDSGDAQAKELLVKSVLKLVVKICKRFSRVAELDDLIQIGNIHCTKAIEDWCPSKGNLLTVVATYVTRGLLRYLERDVHKGIYVPIFAKKEVFRLGNFQKHELIEKGMKEECANTLFLAKQALGVVSLSPSDDFDIDVFDRHEHLPGPCLADIEPLLSKLNQVEREIVIRRIGLKDEPATFVKIAECLGRLPGEARQIYNRCLKRLRQWSICEFCKNQFKLSRISQKYCSRKCAINGCSAKRSDPNKYPLRRCCKGCKNWFIITDPRKHGKLYCDPKCIVGEHWTCDHCGKYFYRKRSKVRFCSSLCGHIADRLKPKPCEFCHRQFQPRKGKSRFCSRSCSSKHKIVSRKCNLPLAKPLIDDIKVA